MKWNNRLKAVLTQTAESGFSEESLETPLTITDKTPLNLVSSAFVSAYSRHSSKNKEGLAELKTDYFHAQLNGFVENGVAFDVSTDDFQVIDTAQNLKVSDKEFLKLN